MDNVCILALDINAAFNAALEYKEKGYKIVGIEAEWGDYDIKDVIIVHDSLAHHGPRSNNKAPCVRWDVHGKYKSDTCFIFSHIDMDSFIGLMVCEGDLDKDNYDIDMCTQLISDIDRFGFHSLTTKPYTSEKYKGMVKDIHTIITTMVGKHRFMTSLSSEKPYTIIDKEIIFKTKENILNILENSNKEDKDVGAQYIQHETSITIINALEKNMSIENMLHVYISDNMSLAKKYAINNPVYSSISEINLLYAPTKKKVTVACRDKEVIEKFFDNEPMSSYIKRFLGEEAGGSDLICGGPRNQEILYDQFLRLVLDVRDRIQKKGI